MTITMAIIAATIPKVIANRPPTPMPMSHPHRVQLRGWQSLLAIEE